MGGKVCEDATFEFTHDISPKTFHVGDKNNIEPIWFDEDLFTYHIYTTDLLLINNYRLTVT